jgi:predicted RNA-binding protein YlxR (DUF448 family)
MPQRRCLLTGQRAEAETLLRFAVVADSVVPDPAHRLPGRGLWLAPAPDAVAMAVARGMFARAAKRKLQVPADLPVRCCQAWTAHAAAQVTKARRAGLVLAEGHADADTVSADATVLGLGRLALTRSPLTRRAVADLALLARLVPPS